MSTTPTRRERLRAATLEEIHAVAHDLLRREGLAGVTMRAIGRHMGMTASALYRYYPSLEELLYGICIDFYAEVCDYVTQAVADLPRSTTAPRLFAACRAFRQWAKAHPTEFTMIFSRPVEEHAIPGRHQDLHQASVQLTTILLTLFLEMIQDVNPTLPADHELPPALREQFNSFLADFDIPIPLGALYAIISSWVRLYGIVALEIYGHMEVWVPDGQPLFEYELAAIARQFGVELKIE